MLMNIRIHLHDNKRLFLAFASKFQSEAAARDLNAFFWNKDVAIKKVNFFST